MAKATPQPLDLESFDAVVESEGGYEFELKQTDGITGTGVFVTVLGKHADVVVKWTTNLINAWNREQALAKRKGKDVEPKSLDELREQNIEGCAIRVTGLRGIKQEFSADLLKRALKRNPHWVEQIVNESDDLGNFPKKP